MKLLPYIVLLLVSVCFGSLWRIPRNGEYINNRLSSVVYIQNSTGVCSGYIVGKNLVATAGHCISYEKGSMVKYTDGEAVPYAVFSFHYLPSDSNCNADWALLMANTGKRKPYVFAKKTPNIGSVLRLLGHPDGDVETHTTPVIYMGLAWDSSIVVNPTTVPGESGGPVVDEQNEVVATITCYSTDMSNTGYASSTKNLQKWIAIAEAK